MDFFFAIISILVITLLIVVHEFGHFLAAKLYGFQTPIFGIGLPFGPYIDLFKKWDTQFRFYFALIGGFVAIPETSDESNEETLKDMELKPLRKFPVYQRAVVAVAGVAFNILFAFIIAIAMIGTTGLPKLAASNKIIEFVDENSAAKLAGLKKGDIIIAVNGTKIKSGAELQETIGKYQDEDINLKVLRDDKTENISVHAHGAIGVKLGLKKEYVKYGSNIFNWVQEAFKYTLETLIMMVFSIIAIFSSLFAKLASIVGIDTGIASSHLGEVKGIVGIVQLITEDIKNNIWMILEFAFLLNLNLAVINLLPIPALDGGYLIFLGYEAIFKKKPSIALQEGLVQAGFIFLLSIMALTTINDIKNFF
ncbi:MAG: site-2 protease family protein [Candidatus Caenarcaniphilales bacterium]|nr:site-2 protease family protein [Candidatus Caenarcaniphilales bacterium]